MKLSELVSDWGRASWDTVHDRNAFLLKRVVFIHIILFTITNLLSSSFVLCESLCSIWFITMGGDFDFSADRECFLVVLRFNWLPAFDCFGESPELSEFFKADRGVTRGMLFKCQVTRGAGFAGFNKQWNSAIKSLITVISRVLPDSEKVLLW